MATEKSPQPPLHLAFDIGHASIGWAVLRSRDQCLPELLGCGAVVFPADDCLVSKRRLYRRQRRHIRATRQRIERLAIAVHHRLKVAPTEQDRAFAALLKTIYVDTPPAGRSAAMVSGPGVAEDFKPDATPWLLAARVLSSKSEEEKMAASLSWPRLWDVLRWYAHNRGYDGNRLWKKGNIVENGDDLDFPADAEEADKDDAEKVKNARRLLEEFGCDTMAETIAAKLNPDGEPRFATEGQAYKTCDAAFPRKMVRREVIKILKAHEGLLFGLDANFIEGLCAESNLKNGDPAWNVIGCPGIKFPKRFQGGLLFGQLLPRFDNRIIGICPASGEKKPLKWCREYLDFRWAQSIANVTVRRSEYSHGKLTSSEKLALTEEAKSTGGFTAGEFKKRVRDLTGTSDDNLDQLLVHPEAARSLELDPARRFARANERIAAVWSEISEETQRAAINRWWRGRPMTLAWFLARHSNLEPILRKLHSLAEKKSRKAPPSWDAWLRLPLTPAWPSGRAPYSRKVMVEAASRFLADAGQDPRRSGGLLDPIRLRLNDERRSLDEVTNNHLVRHRLRVIEGDPQPKNKDRRYRPLLGLLHDIVAEYAAGDKTRVRSCTVEIARELQEFSGKTRKDVESDLGKRLANFRDIVKKLHEDGIERPTAGLIRKARIASDLKWRCPYTDPHGLKPFDSLQLASRALDKDHIIPRSRRASDSLDSLVITYPEINRLKGDMTSLQFMKAHEGTRVKIQNGQEVTIASVKDYLEFVDGLAPNERPHKFSKGPGHLEDKLRRWRRKQRMLVEKWDRQEREFTPGDLTRSSQLMRLAAQRIARWFGWGPDQPQNVVFLPGQVTAEVRKAWHVTGCLIPACPDVRDSEAGDHRTLPKAEIREKTHLHHALDACVLALSSALLPNHGKLWEQIANRKVRETEVEAFHQVRGDVRLYKLGKPEGRSQKLELGDLPSELKNQITSRLLERRVVQRVPADMSGALLEETTWAIEKIEDDRLHLNQRQFEKKDNHRVTGARDRSVKSAKEASSRVLGRLKGKLAQNLGVRIIKGNFGLALFDPALGIDPEVIPHHQVWKRLEALQEKNHGKPVKVIKNGMLIRIIEKPKLAKTDYQGVWRVFSVKDNKTGPALDIARPERVKPENGVAWAGINVSVKSLLGAGLEVLPASLIGVPIALLE